jgi:hypothetical protein
MSVFEFSIRRRDVAWALTLILLVTAVWVARSDVADAGGGPAGDGIALVYVAVGTGFPDSLGVGPGAGANGAPIIIVPTNPPIPTVTADELVRLDPRAVIIVGGTAVVSSAMQDAIAALLPNATIERIAGANRYETNAMFSEQTFPVEAWVSIPTAAFTPDHPDTDDTYIGINLAYNAGGPLSAPIHLPHGAEVLELRAHVSDIDGAEFIAVDLWRITDVGGSELMARASTSVFFASGDATVSDLTIDRAIVDNETYTYLVYVESSAGDRMVRGVKVRYRLGDPTG